MHVRGAVHGRWENIRIEGTKLLADPVFDMDDPESAKIAGKVERGFLKGASLYLHYGKDTTFAEGADGNLELHNSEAFEGSIVDIPSNADSIKLFADNKELNDDEVKGFMLTAIPNHPDKQTTEDKSKTTKMEKFKLSAAAVVALAGIGLSANEGNETEINGLIEKMGAALTAEKTAHQLEKTARENLQNQINAEKAVALTALVDQAVTDGKISATQKETFVALGFDGAKSIIDGLPGKTSLGSQLNNPGGAALGAEPKTMDEFEKLTNEQKLAFKNGNPAGYAALFA